MGAEARFSYIDPALEAEVRDLEHDALHGGEHVLEASGDPRALATDAVLRQTFATAAHAGFEKAQNLIAERLLAIARTAEPPNEVKRREHVYRKLIDSIAWQIIGLQLYVARRLFKGRRQQPSLLESNFESVRRASQLVQAEKPSRFGLLSDLTSFVQVGDLLVVDAEKSSFQIVEVKEGPANERIGKFAEFIAEAQCGRAFQYFREEEGDKGVAQLLRIARQADRMSHVAEVVNKGEGVDPDTGEHVHVPKEPLLMASYDQDLAGLIWG